MCFSAPVSFGASVILASIGSLLVARTAGARLIYLALYPLIFSLHQFIEGMIWLQTPGLFWRNLYLSIAYLWVIWVPFSLWIAEKKGKSKQLLFGLMLLGILYEVALLFYEPFSVAQIKIAQCHIAYFDFHPSDYLGLIILVFYILISTAPYFLSKIKNIKVFGSLIIGSMFVSLLFAQKYFFSIWCFFAALVSLSLFYILDKKTIAKFKISKE